jgi:hypothetical protein
MTNRDMTSLIALKLEANAIHISLPHFVWDENGPNGVFETHNSLFKMQNERVQVNPSIEKDYGD